MGLPPRLYAGPGEYLRTKNCQRCVGLDSRDGTGRAGPEVFLCVRLLLGRVVSGRAEKRYSLGALHRARGQRRAPRRDRCRCAPHFPLPCSRRRPHLVARAQSTPTPRAEKEAASDLTEADPEQVEEVRAVLLRMLAALPLPKVAADSRTGWRSRSVVLCGLQAITNSTGQKVDWDFVDDR